MGKAMRKADFDALDWQERHSPTEAVMVRVTGSRQKEQCRRRRASRLWSDLTDGQAKAAERIMLAHDLIAGPLRTVVMCYEQATGRTASEDEAMDWARRLQEDYRAWFTQAGRERVNVGAVLDVLFSDDTMRDIAKAYTMRKAALRQNFVDGVSLYATLKGWA